MSQYMVRGQIKETTTGFDRRRVGRIPSATGVKVRSSPISAAHRTTPTSVGIPNQENATVETIKKSISTKNLASECPG